MRNNYPGNLRERTTHGNAMFPCAIYNWSSPTEIEERIECHWHEEIELLLITKGEGVLHIDEKTFDVKEGCLAIITSNRLHTAFCEKGKAFDFTSIVFHPEFIDSFANDIIQQKYINPLIEGNYSIPSVIQADEEWKRELTEKVREFIAVYEEKRTGHELILKALLYEILFIMINNSAPMKQVPRGLDYRVGQVKEIMLYISEKYSETISLSELSNHFHMSREHLCRIFKAITHMSPIDYVNYYRINQGAGMLLGSDEDIGKISEKCGFYNANYFSRMFRKYMHMSPTEYRRSQQLSDLQ